MKQIGFTTAILLLVLGVQAQTKAWTFGLTDTAFRLHAVYTTPVPLSVREGHTRIRPEEQPQLDSIAALIRNHPGMILMIGCHSDQRGSDTVNIDFTQQQAENIAAYLRTKGISYYDVAPVGFGERFLLNSEDEIAKVPEKAEKEKLYAANRRVEYTILQTPRNTFTIHDTSFVAGSILHYPFTFVLGKAQLDSSNYPFLDSLATLLIANPQLEIRVENHLDSRWSDKSSNHLSMNRAQSIVTYLSKKGVSHERMMALGVNDFRPIVAEKIVYKAPGKQGREVLHALNRRTEVRIMKVN